MPASTSTTVVVTGSTRGIGLGLAREFGRRGCNVVVCGRGPEGVDTAVAELTAEGLPAERVLGTTVDVADAASVQALWDATVERFGRVDHWINNAGTTTTPVPLHEVPVEQVERVIDTNLTGLLLCTRVAAKGMVQQGAGWIWNVEGLGSKGEVQMGLATYGTSKAGVGYLLKALRKDLDGTGVKVGAIRPGINVTEHLLTDREALTPERWEQTKKIMNILGDLPETTTPWLAEQVLAAEKDGTRIQWLPPTKIAWRFATAWRNKRDLFAEFEQQQAATEPQVQQGA